MTEYSGRTTALAHKGEGWEQAKIDKPTPAISQVTWFEVQWSDCPVEVAEEVKLLWSDTELGNDHYFYQWGRKQLILTNNDEEVTLAEAYPIIDAYLTSKGVSECMIHWWW